MCQRRKVPFLIVVGLLPFVVGSMQRRHFFH